MAKSDKIVHNYRDLTVIRQEFNDGVNRRATTKDRRDIEVLDRIIRNRRTEKGITEYHGKDWHLKLLVNLDQLSQLEASEVVIMLNEKGTACDFVSPANAKEFVKEGFAEKLSEGLYHRLPSKQLLRQAQAVEEVTAAIKEIIKRR